MNMPPVHIVCENGHQGRKLKDIEEALGYLTWNKPHCSFCGSTKFNVKNC
ncbi:MAG: hypothetical protein KGI28_05040 [Thaumarchaeota archaeon]|nr:hypothetical protein [Nitrososphaerota archaeon]